MNATFLIASGLMLALALALVLWPLLRNTGRNSSRRGVLVLGVLLALGLPLGSAGLYKLVGDPAALDPAAAQQPLTIDQAIAKIRAQLTRNSDDPTLWTLLGQAYGAKNEPKQAADAFEHALKFRPDNADLLVAWAQADALSQPGHLIAGEARERLKRALHVDPTHQRGLWLLGISDFQLGQYNSAVDTWTSLLKLVPPDSDVARGIADQIKLATQRGNLTLTKAQSAVISAALAGAPTAATGSGPRITVEVKLAPRLAARLNAAATLYVFARRTAGPPMPLAVTRLPASALPATVTLTNAMSMAPGMDLASVKDVIVGARLSTSGQPLPQAGDLEGNAGPVPVDSKQPVKVIIDKVVGQ